MSNSTDWFDPNGFDPDDWGVITARSPSPSSVLEHVPDQHFTNVPVPRFGDPDDDLCLVDTFRPLVNQPVDR